MKSFSQLSDKWFIGFAALLIVAVFVLLSALLVDNHAIGPMVYNDTNQEQVVELYTQGEQGSPYIDATDQLEPGQGIMHLAPESQWAFVFVRAPEAAVGTYYCYPPMAEFERQRNSGGILATTTLSRLIEAPVSQEAGLTLEGVLQACQTLN